MALKNLTHFRTASNIHKFYKLVIESLIKHTDRKTQACQDAVSNNRLFWKPLWSANIKS